MSYTDEGWGLPKGARKWHYFDRGTSLCNKWDKAVRDDELTPDQSGSGMNDDCATCKSRYEKGYYREDAHHS